MAGDPFEVVVSIGFKPKTIQNPLESFGKWPVDFIEGGNSVSQYDRMVHDQTHFVGLLQIEKNGALIEISWPPGSRRLPEIHFAKQCQLEPSFPTQASSGKKKLYLGAD